MGLGAAVIWSVNIVMFIVVACVVEFIIGMPYRRYRDKYNERDPLCGVPLLGMRPFQETPLGTLCHCVMSVVSLVGACVVLYYFHFTHF